MFIMRFVLRKTKLAETQFAFLKRDFNDVPFEDIPDVSPSEIKKKLAQRNLTFEDGHACFIVSCPMCHKSVRPATTTNRAYINKMTGMFMCPSCKSSGQWSSFQSLLAAKKTTKKMPGALDPNIVNEKDLINEYLERITANTIQLKSIAEESLVNIVTNFDLPVISKKVLDVLDVRIDEEYKKLYFPLENAESDLVGYQVLNRKSKAQTIEPSETCGGILVGKSTRSAKDTAVIVPGIADFIELLNARISGNVICLPNGPLGLSLYILPSFEQYKKLILWFGNDVKSWDVARNFAKKLGEKRCLFIRPTDNQLLPHLRQDQDFKAILSAAQPIWHKSITMFSSLREDVLSDLQNIDKVQGVKWKRYPTLNKILKGHRKGELTVLTGPTGSGKTTFISEYSLDLAMQGVSTLWGSFEIRNSRLARTMLQQFAGMLLEKNLDQFDLWADQFEKLPVYFMTFQGEQAIKVVMEAVEHATYVHDISHVIIDNLQFMMGMSEDPKHGDRYWKQDTIVAAFRNFATRKNCHVTLVIHPRKERTDEDLTTSSIFGGAKASQEADNVLIIQDKRLTSARGKKYLQVAKNRYSGDLGIMALDFDKSSLSYAQKKKKASPEEQDVENQEADEEQNVENH